MEYAWCGDKKLVTRADCKKSCEAMNTEEKSGWTLAVIPTRRHNVEVTKFFYVYQVGNLLYILVQMDSMSQCRAFEFAATANHGEKN